MLYIVDLVRTCEHIASLRSYKRLLDDLDALSVGGDGCTSELLVEKEVSDLLRCFPFDEPRGHIGAEGSEEGGRLEEVCRMEHSEDRRDVEGVEEPDQFRVILLHRNTTRRSWHLDWCGLALRLDTDGISRSWTKDQRAEFHEKLNDFSCADLGKQGFYSEKRPIPKIEVVYEDGTDVIVGLSLLLESLHHLRLCRCRLLDKALSLA
ncbi:hypothetical protein QR680_013421 [Steinernema hermaphroditum]|uniref:Uncharacterized protein n=1 Tax=Steinernema hermaphroditum TaxID=289476 RepID=A0AA39I6T7_9BILA|nr:hypothetical protein QR680_013421 [Steinernema hermaphroditum]